MVLGFRQKIANAVYESIVHQRYSYIKGYFCIKIFWYWAILQKRISLYWDLLFYSQNWIFESWKRITLKLKIFCCWFYFASFDLKITFHWGSCVADGQNSKIRLLYLYYSNVQLWLPIQLILWTMSLAIYLKCPSQFPTLGVLCVLRMRIAKLLASKLNVVRSWTRTGISSSSSPSLAYPISGQPRSSSRNTVTTHNLGSETKEQRNIVPLTNNHVCQGLSSTKWPSGWKFKDTSCVKVRFTLWLCLKYHEVTFKSFGGLRYCSSLCV